MRDIWFLITDHKGIVKILAILIAIFCVVSIGVSSYTSTMKVQEQQEQQAKKKEKEKQIKNSSVKLKKDQQKTIDEYDDATAQFSALLSSNVWATYSVTGRTLLLQNRFLENHSIIFWARKQAPFTARLALLISQSSCQQQLPS